MIFLTTTCNSKYMCPRSDCYVLNNTAKLKDLQGEVTIHMEYLITCLSVTRRISMH
jgi:hypothetical protein